MRKGLLFRGAAIRRPCHGDQAQAVIQSEILLAKVGEGRSIHAYPEAQIVFSQGDPADAVFYIQRGKVKITVVSKVGKEAVVAILGANDFFGEGCLAGQRHRIATAMTMTDSVVVRLQKAAILSVIRQEPAFAALFIAHLLGRTIRAESDLVDQLFNSSEKRLAACSCCWRTLARKTNRSQ